MALITWTDKLSVGVKTIDDQHTILCETLNELHAAMMRGQARIMVGSLLRTLVDYTHHHFAAEEAMMKAAQYPGLAQHCIKHRELTKEVEEYVARYEQGDITLSLPLLNFLSNWLTTHIQSEDKQYSPWLIQHGVR
jgi:hemerythrin-like metal-binding protein